MNMKEWLCQVKTAPAKKPIPVLSFPCINLMGITVKDLVYSSALQAEGMERVACEVPTGASVSMMDLSVEAEAFGSTVHVTDREVPTVVGSIIQSEEDAQALVVPKVGAGRTGTYVDAIREACKRICDRPVFAGVIGPFSLAGRLMDVTEAMVNCYTEPDMVHITMKKATDFLISYINAYKEAGANGIVMAEPLSGLLSPALVEEFVEPYLIEIIKTVQNDQFLVIYHNCGNNTILTIDSILRTGAAAYHFGNAISMKEMLTKIPDDILVMGNIDPSGVFLNGTPESVRQETLSLLKDCAAHPNFVISSGCDIPPETPWENIHAFFDAVAEFYEGKAV